MRLKWKRTLSSPIKHVLVLVLWLLFLSSVTSGYTIIKSSVSNAVQYIKQTVFTDSGINSGNTFVDINAASGYVYINKDQIFNWSSRNLRFLALDSSWKLIYAPETDPTVWQHIKNISIANITNRNSAHNWVVNNGDNALYFRNHSGNYLLTANSGTYYHLNPSWYITGWALFW